MSAFFKSSRRSITLTLTVTATAFALVSAVVVANCDTICLQAAASAEQQMRSSASGIIATSCAQAASTGSQGAYDSCVAAINSQIDISAFNLRNTVLQQCSMSCHDV